MEMIEVKSLYHDYEGKGKYAVEDVSFSIEKGEILGFLGPSGAGKTTVQNIMTSLLPLQKGDVLYDDVSIKKMKSRFFNRIGVSFEDPTLYLKLTGYENLKYFAGLFDVPTKDPARLLEMVDLQSASHRRAAAYSKGMKQRLVFIRSLINDPEILFLDEPTAGLDPALAKKIKEIILAQKKEGKTIFLTTHNMFIADELCDRVAFINEGKLVTTDSPRKLKLKYGDRSAKVEYLKDNKLKKEVLFFEKEEDLKRFNTIIETEDVQTVHTQEATLEQIFIKLTGRELI
jgi:fluoroquinolone transport system ATP-binding protein